MSQLQLQKTPLRQVNDVRGLLMNEQARDQLAAVATKHMNPERMMRVVANSIRTTPKLQQCEPMSLLGALMQCAALGLEPNTILGHAYLIPFDRTLDRGKSSERKITEVQLVVGYKGLIDLARRSGHITSIHAGIHYSDDEATGGLWEYEEGTEARLRHRNGDMAGKKLHAYAIAKFKDGGHAYVVLPWSHVMRIRDASQGYQQAVRYAKKDTPWIAHEDAMAKKTAIRALSKYLPLSVEFVDAISVDEKKADYRAFAMDPTMGIAPEIDEIIDAEAEPAQIEQNTATDPVQEQLRKPAQTKQPTGSSVPQEQRPSRHDLQKQHREAQAKPKEEAPEVKPKQADPEPEAQQDSGPEPETHDEPDLFAEQGGEVQSEEAPTGPDPFASPFGKTFLTDVTDMGFDQAMGFHGEEMARLQGTNPAMYAAILAESRKIDPATP